LRFEQAVSVEARPSDVWVFIQDVPRMGECLPGLESVTEDGNGGYVGALKITVGPISVRLEGKMRIGAVDAENHSTQLEVEAGDRRIRSSVRSTTTMTVVAAGDDDCQLLVTTEAAIAGKLGQFGQAVLRKKTDQLLCQFAENMARILGAPAPDAVSPTER
jgi:carbon monoxide dehydrogenase subunit G